MTATAVSSHRLAPHPVRTGAHPASTGHRDPVDKTDPSGQTPLPVQIHRQGPGRETPPRPNSMAQRSHHSPTHPHPPAPVRRRRSPDPGAPGPVPGKRFAPARSRPAGFMVPSTRDAESRDAMTPVHQARVATRPTNPAIVGSGSDRLTGLASTCTPLVRAAGATGRRDHVGLGLNADPGHTVARHTSRPLDPAPQRQRSWNLVVLTGRPRSPQPGTVPAAIWHRALADSTTDPG